MNKAFLLFMAVLFSCKVFSQEVIEASTEDFCGYIQYYENAVIIDVCEANEYNKSHLVNAINAPTKKQLVNIADTLDKDTPLLVYCDFGHRSLSACNVLLNLQFKTVINLSLGLKDWRKKRYPIVK